MPPVLQMDADRGLFFADCTEGKATILGLKRDGALVASLQQGAGVDIIADSRELHHYYLPGGRSSTRVILGVGSDGGQTLWCTARSAARAHCVAADDRTQAWVRDPEHGQLRRVRDTLPAEDG